MQLLSQDHSSKFNGWLHERDTVWATLLYAKQQGMPEAVLSDKAALLAARQTALLNNGYGGNEIAQQSIFESSAADVGSGVLGAVTGMMTIGSVAGRPVGLGGGVLAEDEEIVVFESARGSGKIKIHDPEGQSAQSLAVAGSPEQAYQGAFGRSPSSGEPYWQTTAGQIASTGRFAYLDAAGSPGHVSIYGGSNRNPIEFIKIWTRRIFGP
jgi:hypothetical protein